MEEELYLPPLKSYKYLTLSEKQSEHTATFNDLLEIIENLTEKELNALKVKVNYELDRQLDNNIAKVEEQLKNSGKYVKNARINHKFLAKYSCSSIDPEKPESKKFWTTIKEDLKVGDILEIKEWSLSDYGLILVVKYIVTEVFVECNYIKFFRVRRATLNEIKEC